MQDQNKEMHLVDEELFFVIDEKTNTIELTEKGLNLMTTSIEEKDFFILPIYIISFKILYNYFSIIYFLHAIF